MKQNIRGFFWGGGYWGESKAQLLQHTMMAFEEEHFVRSGQFDIE
jgi:hypothetical protein